VFRLKSTLYQTNIEIASQLRQESVHFKIGIRFKRTVKAINFEVFGWHDKRQIATVADVVFLEETGRGSRAVVTIGNV